MNYVMNNSMNALRLVFCNFLREMDRHERLVMKDWSNY